MSSLKPEAAAQAEESRVTPADLRRAMWRHFITLQWSWNYERMQALGWLWSMLPILQKVYPERERLIEAMKRHISFYNTNPQIGSPPIFGAAVALEEKGAGEAADSVKVGLMGPLAGIGDTIQAILYRPIVAVFAATLALNGSAVGPFLMILSGLLFTALMFPLFWAGYRQGTGIVAEVAGGRLQRLTEGATILGLTVIGGFVPSIMSGVTTPLKLVQHATVQGKAVEKTVELQQILDQLLPYMLPVAITALAYWMLRGLKLSPVMVLLILTVLAFVASALGIL